METVRKELKKYSQFEQMLLLFVVILAVVSFVLLICLIINTNDKPVCYTPECINAAYHILNTVDQTVDPCEDFYKFSCGNFLKDAIARDQVSPLKAMDERKKNGLKQIVIEELESEDNLTTSVRNQRKFYRACMNTTAIQEDNDKTFITLLKEVTGGWPLSQGYTEDLHWPDIMIRAREKGLRFNYFLNVDIRYAHNESSVYLEISSPPVKNFDAHLWKEANLQKIMEMAEHWGDTTLSATWELRKTIEFAKKLKEIVETTENEMKNKTLENKKMTISELKNLPFLKFDWLKFLKNISNLQNLKETDTIIFNANKEYFENLYYLIQKTPIKFWVNYIVLLIITDEQKFLSKKIENICKEITSPSKYTSRREYCFDESIEAFDGVAEAEYMRRVVTNEKRKHIQEIINTIKEELKESLKINKWMDKQTKDLAIAHLKNVTELIGWTDAVFNKTEFDRISGFDRLNFKSDNVIKMNQELYKLYYDLRFRRIGTNQSNYFDMVLSTPVFEVNAFYVKYVQVLILIAPILHPPVYDPNRPEYMNYGSLGSIIGHELTHAMSKVDDDWQMFDKQIIDYWSNDTLANYETEAECINGEYKNHIENLDGEYANATDTHIENVADFTGLNLAYKAYQKWIDRHGTENQLPGVKYSPNQLFWIMASTYMCLEPKLQDSEKTNTYGRHSVASFRVTGPIRNSPYFGKDFGCPEGSKMNPKNKCRIFL